MNNAINGKRRALRLGTGIATCISSVFLAHTAFGQALPELANAGGANVSTVGNTLTVDALAANRVINWNTFSVDAGNTVNFVSTAAAVTDATPITVVNRVIGMDVSGTQTFFPSYINGAINASNGGNNNISVWLINPSGITFGPTGAFSGVSLVVSSLDFIGAEDGSDAFSGTSVRLQRKTLGLGEALGLKNDVDGNPLTAMEIKLVPGAGTIATEGSLVLLGEQINIGKDVDANGEVLIVAASDVSFTPTTGSPISFNILAGTEMGGVQVLGTGEVNGRNIVVAASNATNTLSTLLQVDTGGRLIASADNGGVTLTTSSDPINVLDPVAAANIDSQGLLSATGLNGGVTVRSNASATAARITATGDVLVRSGAGATDTVAVGTVQTDGGIDVASTGDLTLGIAGTETILAGGAIDLESTGGAINSTSTDLTIRSNRADAGTGALRIDAVNAIDLGSATLTGGATRTAAVTVQSDTGSVEIGGASASKLTGTAATTFTANDTVNGGNSTAVAGNAVSITAAGGITLTTARAIGTDQDLRLTTDGAVLADVLSAERTVVIGSSGAPVSSLTVNTDLTATTGNINAFADAMSIAAATAGTNVTLRSDGAIAVTGKVEAGDTLLAKGITTDYAASFTAGTAQANTGSVTATADAIDVGALRAGTTGSLQGKTSIALGSGLLGGNLTVETDLDNAAGDIALGASGASSIVSDGRITVKSTFGAVNRGTGSTSLTLRSNADDVGTDALSVTANNAVALGNARLDGGTLPSAAVTVTSTTSDVTLGTANATKFTGSALAGTFTSTGTITADNSTVGAGNAIQIDAANIALATAKTNGTDQDIRLLTTGAVDAAAINASRNVVISTLANPASRIGSSSLKPILTATAGSISAFAGAMTMDKATAATSISLRSDGAISADGAVEAGTSLTVSGVTGTHAGAFTASTAEATAGAVSLKALAIDVGTVNSGTSTLLDATVAGGTISVGKVDAGTSYSALADGDITLGRAGAKTQTAGDAVTIDSATGSIIEGTTGVTLTSNDDNAGAELLTLDAGDAISLANATLNGGTTQSSDISLTSVNGTAIDEAFAADITVTSAGAVQANMLTAGGNVTVKGVGAGYAASLTAVGGVNGATIDAGSAISVKAGAINVASATSGTTTALDAQVAGGTIAIGTVDAGTDYSALATGNITLGRAFGFTQTANGKIDIVSTTGSILETTANIPFSTNLDGITLTANLDGIGGEALTVSAGDMISLAQTTMRGSNVFITSANDAAIARVSGQNIEANVGGEYSVDPTISLGENSGATANYTINAGSVVTDTLSAGGNLIITSPGSVTAFELRGGTVTIKGVGAGYAGPVSLQEQGGQGALVRSTSGAVSIKASSMVLQNVVSATSVSLDAAVGGGTIHTGSVTAGTDFVATADNTITVGRGSGKVHSAGGKIELTAGGSIINGTSLVELTSNADGVGVGVDAMTLNAGDAISLGNTILRGGTMQTSDVSLTSVNDTTIDEAYAANFSSTAGGAFTANLVDTAVNTDITAGSAAVKAIDATGDITVTSAGAVRTNTLTAGGNVTVKGVGSGYAASLASFVGNTGSGISAGSAISVKAGAINVASATSGTSTTLDAVTTGGTIAVGSVDAGADYVANATGDIELGRGGATTQTAGGAITIDSATGSISEGANNVTLTSNDDGIGTDELSLSAGDAIALADATLRGGLAQTSAVTLTSVNGTAIDEAFSADFTADAGGLFAANRVDANGNAAITAGSVAAKVVDATGDITVTSAGAVQANTLAAGGNVTVKGVGAGYAASLAAIGGTNGATITATTGAISTKAAAINVASATSGTSTTLDALIAGGTIAVGAVDAGTSYSALADGDIMLGQATRKTQTAGDAVTIDSTTGSIIQGTTGVMLTSNDNNAGAELLTLDAGNAISLANATLNGGTTQSSDISLTSANGTTIDEAFAANFGSTAGGAFTADLVDTAVNASITAGSVAAKVVDATGDITVTSAGAVQANTLTAGGNVTVKGVGAGYAASLAAIGGTNGSAITAGSAISVKAGAINVASATSGTSTTLDAVTTGGTIAVGSVDAGTDYVANATGDITLGRGGATTQTAGGAITIDSATGSISEGAAGVMLTSNDDNAGGELLTLDAGNAIALGKATLRGGAGQTADVSLTSANGTTVDKVLAANAGANAGAAFTANLVDANGNATITAGSVAATTVDATGDITVTSAGAVQANTLAAGGNVTVKGVGTGHAASLAAIGGTNGSAITAGSAISVKAGAINVASAVSGTSTTLDAAVAGGTIAVGSVDAGTDYVANATGDITLGRAGNKTQTAAGAVTITSTGGSINEGTTGVLLTSNDAGSGTSALTLAAGSAIGLGNATLNGGSSKQSAVSVTSGAGTTVGIVNSAAFNANAVTTFTANDAITAAGTAAITAGGAVTLDTVTTQGAGSDIVVTSPGAVAAGTLLAARNVTVGGPSAGNAASFTGNSVTATAGTIAVKAGATDIGAAVSGLDTTVSGTTATLGTVTAGGNYAVTTTGAVTLGKAGGQTQAAKGSVAITSSNGAIGQGANGLTLTSNSDGSGTEALTLNAKTDIALAGATLKGGSVKQSAVSLTSGGNTVVGSVLGASLTANAGGAFETRSGVDVATNAAITSVGAIALDGTVAAGNAVNLKSSNATIAADVTAKTIDVFNSGAATGKLAIGDGVTTAAADFALSAAEVSRLKASDTLTLGSDAAHNVEVGSVQFTVPKTVSVPASAKRIDVTGRIVFDGDTKLKLGSSGTTIIQLSTTKGGSIASDGGVLELSAANIVSGADDFAADLSAVSGSASSTGSRDAAFAMNLNPGSKLYNPSSISNDVMVDVGSMKVTFTGFAMFQNTGNSLVGAGVKLGNGNPSSLALDIVNGSTQPVFAAFGSINGIINAATALLGNPPLSHYDNISASRLNGCVIGGGNCQSVQNLTPSLTALDNIRTSIFTVKPDFQVPFDPLVGTNNDALFDDVGSFGLGELPMTPIECSDPNGTCDVQKKDGN